MFKISFYDKVANGIKLRKIMSITTHSMQYELENKALSNLDQDLRSKVDRWKTE